MLENFGPGVIGGFVLIDPDTGQPYRATSSGPTGNVDWDTQVINKPATFTPTIGTGATEAVAGNDARLTNTRIPSAHKTSHAIGGSDPLTSGDIGAATLAQGALADTAVQPAGLSSAIGAITPASIGAATASAVSTLSGEVATLTASSDTITRVTLTGSYVVTPDAGWGHESAHAIVLTQDDIGSHTVTYAATVSPSDGDILPVIPGVAGSETWVGFVWSNAISKWIPTLIQTITPPDTVAPIVGTGAATNVAATTLTYTITGASDARGLNSAPYALSTDDGATYATYPYQTSNVFSVTGLTASTAYNLKHKVRDAALNESVSTTTAVTTTAAFQPSLTAHAADGTDAATYTWAGISLGAAATDRVIIIPLTWRAGTATTITSATIGGVAATIDLQGNVNASTGIGFLRAAVPTGTTGTIVVNFSGTVVRLGYGVRRIIGATLTPSSTAVHATAATVTNPTGGYVIAAAFTPTNSMTGVTTSHSDAIEGYYFIGGTSTTAGAVTATVSGAYSGVGAVAYAVS